MCCQVDHRIAGINGLNHCRASSVSPTAAPHHLGDQVKGTLVTQVIFVIQCFCDIYGVFFVSEDENAAALAAKAFFDTLVLENKEQQQKLIVLGPSPARISKISNTYRYRLAIKCKNSKSVRNLLMQVLKATVKMKELRKVQISIDLNPIDLG